MAGIGDLGKIVEDFKESVAQAFGGAGNNQIDYAHKGKVGPLDGEQPANWVGNAGTDKNKVKYGFATITLDAIAASGDPETVYYLDIAPQAITQKEIFANNITATRKGVIVESEGVVFKDILIQGTTGIFPGKRGQNAGPIPNFNSFTSAPKSDTGVDANTGRSRASNVSTISGYEEFILLRKFFLKYAEDKVQRDGNLFLLFINEKDNQTLIVEPQDFTMERNARSPMTYNYKIALKGIGDFKSIVRTVADSAATGFFAHMAEAGNLAANIEASIRSARSVINASAQMLTRISQSADRTINGPLRQIQFGAEDLKNGATSVISSTKAISSNASMALDSMSKSFEEFKDLVGGRASTSSDGSGAADYVQRRDFIEKLGTDNKSPIPRSYMVDSRDDVNDLQYDLADFLGLGDPLFDEITGRTATQEADPLREVSDEEFLLLGAMADAATALNEGLATNVLFESDAELAFEQSLKPFQSSLVPEDLHPNVQKPARVREITIQRNDTLERIAQREYNDALRWIDIVILNSLKPPYISEDGGDGVVKPGEKILIGVD